ncbi:hypothetical protein FF1_019093 [Malus domestica]
MGKTRKMRDVMGAIKDKASQSKAAILSKLSASASAASSSPYSLHLTLLRATTHDPFAPPPQKHLANLLSFGNSSRATASAAVESLMDRLQTTHDSAVAIKCLLAVHHVIKYGSFILQDQLAVYPAAGGRNYLNLSNFRDDSTPLAWELSSWVRWYAQYVENLLLTSRLLGFFLGSNSCTVDKEKEEDRVSALMNAELVRETESLVSLMEEICRRPVSLDLDGNRLMMEILGLVGEDQICAMNETIVRVNEFDERLSCLSLCDSVELLSALKRSEECEGRLLAVPNVKSDLVNGFWRLIKETVVKAAKVKEEEGNGKLVVAKRRHSLSESARFGDRDIRPSDSVRFPSGRPVSFGY